MSNATTTNTTTKPSALCGHKSFVPLAVNSIPGMVGHCWRCQASAVIQARRAKDDIK